MNWIDKYTGAHKDEISEIVDRNDGGLFHYLLDNGCKLLSHQNDTDKYRVTKFDDFIFFMMQVRSCLGQFSDLENKLDEVLESGTASDLVDLIYEYTTRTSDEQIPDEIEKYDMGTIFKEI